MSVGRPLDGPIRFALAVDSSLKRVPSNHPEQQADGHENQPVGGNQCQLGDNPSEECRNEAQSYGGNGADFIGHRDFIGAGWRKS